jgi:hypothetical protein
LSPMDADVVPSERFRTAAGEMLDLVRQHQPQRFYRREPRWRAVLMAFIFRMAGTVETMMSVVDDGRQMDTLVLLRTPTAEDR